MSDFVFPASDLDRPDRQLYSLGGFWSSVYAARAAVQALVSARAAIQRDAVDRLNEVRLMASRQKTPVYRTVEWQRWVLRAGDRTERPARYGAAGLYGETTIYGRSAGVEYRWPAPAGLAEIEVITNRTADASLLWVHGIDFVLDDGDIVFRSDPFLRSDVAVAEAEDSADNAAALWLYRGRFDEQTMDRQYGYAVGLRLPTSRTASAAVNAVYDAIVEGTTWGAVRALVAAATDTPIGRGGEVVEQIFDDGLAQWVVTDQSAYRIGRSATARVAVGDVLAENAELSDAYAFHDFHRGQVPADLSALAVGRGFLAEGYFSDLVFRNETVPWEISTDEAGYTRMQFQLHGFPGDVEQFWDDVHAAGVAAGQTLAHLLDQRPVPEGEPTPMALPSTVNPLEFLISQLWRANLGLLRLKPASYGPDAIPEALRAIRLVIPPGCALVILVELRHTESPITMDGPGDAVNPGYSETVAVFLGAQIAETIDGSTMITERVTPRRVGGACV